MDLTAGGAEAAGRPEGCSPRGLIRQQRPSRSLGLQSGCVEAQPKTCWMAVTGRGDARRRQVEVEAACCDVASGSGVRWAVRAGSTESGAAAATADETRPVSQRRGPSPSPTLRLGHARCRWRRGQTAPRTDGPPGGARSCLCSPRARRGPFAAQTRGNRSFSKPGLRVPALWGGDCTRVWASPAPPAFAEARSSSSPSPRHKTPAAGDPVPEASQRQSDGSCGRGRAAVHA